MNTSRRRFLQTLAGSSAVAAFAPGLPELLQRTAWAVADQEPASDRVLIVTQLSGGNDGLNTLVPYGDDAYGRSRTTLRLTAKEVLKVNSLLGFHPAVSGFHKLFEAGRLMVAQGVGYPHSTRDHNGALLDWHTARPGEADCPTGWLGRMADQASAPGSPDIPAMFVGPIATPFALNGRHAIVPAVNTPTELTLRAGSPPLRAVAGAPATSPTAADNPLLQVAAENLRAARQLDHRVQDVLQHGGPPADYPPYTLAGQLRSVAQLIRAGLGVRVFFTELGGGGIGGFDNHANQRDNHAALLRELSESVTAFADDLARDATLDRVLLMTFSEFGRTLSENGRRGTGHGAAAPMFLVGGGLRGGLLGNHPSLTDLDQDAPKHHTDFRQIYATVLHRWLGLDSGPILEGEFAEVDLVT